MQIGNVNWTGSEVNKVVKLQEVEKQSSDTIINNLKDCIASHEKLLDKHKIFNSVFADSDLSSVIVRLEQNITQLKKIIHSLND